MCASGKRWAPELDGLTWRKDTKLMMVHTAPETSERQEVEKVSHNVIHTSPNVMLFFGD